MQVNLYRGNLNEAEKIWFEILDKNPTCLPALTYLSMSTATSELSVIFSASLVLDRADLDRAAELLGRAAALAPYDDDVLKMKVELLIQQKKVDVGDFL